MRPFGKMAFSRSSWPSPEAWEAFLRIDTSLLRAACWTLASGMRLASHVKALNAERPDISSGVVRFLSEAGAPCGSRFQSKRDLRCHQLRSKLHGQGRQTSVFSSVITNYCPWCRSTFSSSLIARQQPLSINTFCTWRSKCHLQTTMDLCQHAST